MEKMKMRIIMTELRKIFSNRIFLLIIAVVFIMNAYLMFRTANSDDAKPSDYKYIYSELEGLTDSEKLAVFDERINNSTQGLYDYNWELYYELANECYDVVNYKAYLENIETQAESMQSISIFANPDTFNYRSIIKTPSAYQNVQEVQPVFDVSQGIILATDNDFSDILIGFILLFSVLSVMISDREQGMSCLLFSLKRGRSYLLFMKFVALAITVFSVVSLIYLENLIISSYIYGLGNLLRPIQSINGFIGCNLNINVLLYLVVYILFKSASIFLIGTVLSLVAIFTKNTISFYGISAVTIIIEVILYKFIEPLSIYSIFKYINIISFTKINDIFCNYKNINFFEYPVPLISSSFTAIITSIVILSFIAAYIYAKNRNLEFRRLRLKFINRNEKCIHSGIFYTLYKSIVLQKGSVIICIFISVSVFMTQSFSKEYDISDVYYKYYVTQLDGEIDDSTNDFMISEDKHFQELNYRIDELSQSAIGFSAELNELQKEYAPSMGFYLVKERYDKIKNEKYACIFYDTGYKRMFGKNGYDDDMKYSLMSMLLCIFLISPMIANDNKYHMQSVINSTSSGKKQYIKRNVIIASIYGCLSGFIWLIGYSINIYKFYGFNGLNASIHSITDFIALPLNIKVWQYIVLIYLLRIIVIIFASLIMLYISSKCKNTTIALLVNFAIFVLPVIMYLLGADIMVNTGFNPLLSVNALLNNFSIIQLVFPVVILGVLVSIKIKSYISL